MKRRLLTVLAVTLMALGASAPAFADGPDTGIGAFCDNAADLVPFPTGDYC